ncbi:Transcriptional regulator, XRE family [Acidithiobacillus ferrivorans]|uniref:Transcriptional regulator, XRE family n=1 Tax=Acidithiobacillus ferrivorans TaxID=160808 RepID=A0A060UN69_9PROT|nr:RodZ domain-containing protein [Acidithiobacillus ferrivorans]CDQ10072.1 Transcriptional regulator, XRE family [Acidithiobacillus ferrivorans]SMH64033.1 Transcriptional regulator, XRE family [Acidithiobacillus ferrivorans]
MDPITDSEISQDLRTAREAHGWSLHQVAERLHITEVQVKGLEEGNYAALPGAAFARGFLKNYARLLELNPEPLLKTYDASNEGSGLHPSENVLPNCEGPLLDYSRRMLIFSGLTMIAVIVAVWWFWSQQRAQGLPAMAASPTTAVKHPAAFAPVVSAAPRISPAILAPRAVTQASVVAVGQSAVPVAVTQFATAAVGPGLVFQFSADCWVQVKDASGKTLLAVLGQRGKVLRIDSGTPPYHVLVGKASAVVIRYNGKLAPLPANALGVARLQIGTAPTISTPVSGAHVMAATLSQVPSSALPIASVVSSPAAVPSTAAVSSEVSHAP